MGYTAGTLDLEVLGYSDKAVGSITATVKALNSLTRAIKKAEDISFTDYGQRLEALFSKIARATNSINTRNIENLASAAKSLSAISRVGNLEKVDYDKVGKGFSNLTVAITPFVDKVKEAEGSLTALYGVLSKAGGKKIQNLLGGGANGGVGNGLFNFAKMGASIYMIRRMARYTADIVKAGSDYLETMNLWQVAMRNNLDLADEFVDKMNKAYGVSTKTTMQAQATFKNMIGSLGDLSDETAYKLSEAITQMAFDYSSLYNVQLSQAVDKFQSALAGQVRPIRSISGYDITEKTIHNLYQSIGGTKTQRQLSRTEKQLLAILAVFNQMEASGAVGDLGKTLDLFANQSRMMVENFTELKSWTGLLLVDLIESWGIMKYLNAALITITEIVKAIAKARGVGDENFVAGFAENAEEANKQMDELNGKLLDFDKFRSLSGQEEGIGVQIDQVVLDAISEYTSMVDEAVSSAQNLAETWLKFWVAEDGNPTQQANSLLAVLGALVEILGILLSMKVFVWMGHFVKGLFAIKVAGQSVGTLGIAVLIYLILEMVEALAKGDKGMAIFAGSLALVTASIMVLRSKKLSDWFIDTAKAALKASQNINLMNGLIMALGVTILAIGVQEFLSAWDDMSGAQRAIGIFVALAGAITAAAIAMNVFGMNWAGAVGIAAMVAGGALAVTSSIKIPNYENGASDIDSGTVFRAGEFGKTEAVYTGNNGKTNVANVRQMEQAFYNALSRHSREGNGTIVVQTYLDGEKVYENTTAKAKARGKVWASV